MIGSSLSVIKRDRGGTGRCGIADTYALAANFPGATALRFLLGDQLHHIEITTPTFTHLLRNPVVLRKLIFGRSPLPLAQSLRIPNGELDTVSNIQRRMEQTGFEVHDVEALRPHYALTLRHWTSRLEERREEALEYVSESAYCVW